MFSVRRSRVRQDSELGRVFSKETKKETKSWACVGLGNVFSEENQELGWILN